MKLLATNQPHYFPTSLRRVRKHRVINQVRRRIDPPIELRLGQSSCLRQQAPEKCVHGARQAGNIHVLARTGQSLQELKHAHDAPSRPPVNFLLLLHQLQIGKRRLLPGPVCAQVFQIVRKRPRQYRADACPHISDALRLKIKLAQFLQQLIHQRKQQLSLRAKMLVETPHCELGPPGDLVDGSILVALFAEECEPGRFQPLSFRQTSLLNRLGRKLFARKQIGTRVHVLPGFAMLAPTSAPAQHHSIHPPNTPATDGAMFGKTTGKNALEKGSSRSVGSAIKNPASSHCSRGSPNLEHIRRTINPIRGKLMANRIRIPTKPPGRSKC